MVVRATFSRTASRGSVLEGSAKRMREKVRGTVEEVHPKMIQALIRNLSDRLIAGIDPGSNRVLVWSRLQLH
jgi:hypothetical protein